MEASLLGVVGSSRFEDAIDLREEFSHEGDDDLLGFLAVCDESICNSFEEGI